MSLVTEASSAESPGSSVAIGRKTSAAAIGVGMTTLMLLMGGRLLGDPDTQWHIAVGHWILAHRAVPTTDLFSYTQAGAPWIAKEWVSQLLLFFAFEGAGWRGVVMLTAVVAAGSFVALHAWLSKRMRSSAAMVMSLAAFVMCEPHMLARPHILVVPLIVAWLIALVDALERRVAPSTWCALIVVAWTNMHGSFPFALIMGCVLAGEAVAFAPADQRPSLMRRWAVFLAVSVLATMISPFGWRTILVPLMMFGNVGTLRFVNEWQPLAPDTLGATAALMLLATVTVLLLDARRNVFRILAIGLVAYLMIRHARFVTLFGLISPILAARTVALRFPPRPRAPSDIVEPKAFRAVIAASLTLAVVLAVALRPQPGAGVTPTAAYAAALSHGAHGRVYNDYDFGGFLIAHNVKTFIDGRTDQLFLGDFIPNLTRAVDAEDDANFAAVLAKAGAEWALIRPDSRTSAHLDRLPRWTRVYKDKTAAAYVLTANADPRARD